MGQKHSDFSECCLFCTVEVNVADVSCWAKAVKPHIVAIQLSIAFQSSKAHTLEHTPMLSTEDSENENDRFQLAFKSEGVEGDKTTKMPIDVLFIQKLGIITNNYLLYITIPRYKHVQTVSVGSETKHSIPQYLALIT